MAAKTAAKTSKKKNTTSKNTTKIKNSTNKKGQTPKKEDYIEDREFLDEIPLWIVLGISILLFISNFGVGGIVGAAVSGVLFGLFGIIAYIIPIVLILGTFFTVSNRRNTIAIFKLVAAILFVLFVCVLIELCVHKGSPYNAVDAYIYGKDNKLGGGFFGGLIAKILFSLFGYIGAFVIDIIVLIVSFLLIVEKAAFRGLQTKTQEARQSVRHRKNKKELAERKKHHDKERGLGEENMTSLPRRERKVSGVDFSHTKTKGNDLPVETSDEMSEVKIKIFDNPVEISEVERVSLSSGTKSETNFASSLSDAQTPEGKPEESYDEPVDIPMVLPRDESEENVPIAEETLPKEDKIEQTKEVITNDVEILPIEQKEIAEYKFPPISYLKRNTKTKSHNTKTSLQETAAKLQQTLKNFGVNVTITDVSCGPAVTRYELQPEMGVKVSKIVNLSDDIKLNLAAEDIRIEAPIPGKAAVGIEVPNKENIMVTFRELMESQEFKDTSSKIAFAAGRDIAGSIIISDIAKMPHLLIAGATGSGKSVCINTIIMSILYKARPDEVKFIMIDPKVVELSIYNDIPHLLIPVVTDPKKAAGALNWAVKEMMNRYNLFAEAGVKDMAGYNNKIVNGKLTLHINGTDMEVDRAKMPQIVVVVDELADLMMVASSEVEAAICRLAQLARAAGIHLIIATQRPSVNVITGLIKANMPSRIAFSVTSGVDSRTILDMNGAEKLLGKGDMLYFPQTYPKPVRIQGAFVSEEEVQKVTDFIRKQKLETNTEEQNQILNDIDSSFEATVISNGDNGFNDERDAYFEAAGRLVIEKEKGSIGMLQRNFKVGFNRAARIMDQLEEAGVVGPEEGTKPRRVLMSINEFEDLM